MLLRDAFFCNTNRMWDTVSREVKCEAEPHCSFALHCLLLVCLFVLNSAVDDALVADYNLFMLFCNANDLMMKECFVLVCRALHSADVKF